MFWWKGRKWRKPKALVWIVEPNVWYFGSIENIYIYIYISVGGKSLAFCTCEMFSRIEWTHTFILGVVNHHFSYSRIHYITFHSYILFQRTVCIFIYIHSGLYVASHTYIMFYSWCKVRFVVARDSSKRQLNLPPLLLLYCCCFCCWCYNQKKKYVVISSVGVNDKTRKNTERW